MLSAPSTPTEAEYELEWELKNKLRLDRAQALIEGRHWDVADVMAIIWPPVRNALQVRSLVTGGASDE